MWCRNHFLFMKTFIPHPQMQDLEIASLCGFPQNHWDTVLYIHLTHEPCLFGNCFVSCNPVCAVDVPSLWRPLTRMVTLLDASIESYSKLLLFRFGWRPSSNNPSFYSPWVSKEMTCGMFSPMIILSNNNNCFPSCFITCC